MSRERAIRRVIDGNGSLSRNVRRAAFANAGVTPEPVRALVDKIALHAAQIDDRDIAAAKAAGLGEDDIFELAVAASLGQSKRQLDAALAALAEATGES